MILFIDTIAGDNIILALKKGKDVLARKEFEARRQQAEKLLPEIDKLLKKQRLTLKDIEKIEINNSGGSFTSLRIGVVTANALAYAIGVPIAGVAGKTKKTKGIQIVAPEYNQEPVITVKKKGLV
ncbi:MAG: Glycoprotease family protein [Parcubacteria group bacterium GW2011_GWE2_39_37]|uniref:Glycoprotease family protein n=1 Tax=Candidatus Falkowbacteria bacterium GW2011_GWF2_39_8 TaxID=1618642 RepID=A0A0G0SDN2_9BACT|nr:MAG: Glycoprotease family protein [Parcubacteria group bacterium GW2011_GWE2_39_37]KKR32810.1 MAG: Glycoprotease family protein [Candidatus Falkowbacteria bacterium GW2011_GWF2_39_8]